MTDLQEMQKHYYYDIVEEQAVVLLEQQAWYPDNAWLRARKLFETYAMDWLSLYEIVQCEFEDTMDEECKHSELTAILNQWINWASLEVLDGNK